MKPSTPSILQALFEPTRTALFPAAGEEHSKVRGLALLVDARFADYQRQAVEAGWPTLGEPAPVDAEPEQRLLSAVSLQLSGAAVAAVRLDELAAEPIVPAEVSLAAAVFASIAYRDAGRPDLAVKTITRLQTETSLAEALALIHLAVAQQELGDPRSALDASLNAEAALRRHRRASVIAEALRAVASRNVVAFGFAAGDHKLAFQRRQAPKATVLDQLESRVASGLASWLEQEFDGRFEDPTVSTVSFRQEDPVQTPLIGALLRAELLGDWHLAREARKRLGRYQLLASLGEDRREPVPAFHLLRRAGDIKGLERALRWYRSEGPLVPLRAFGDGLATMPWTVHTVREDLAGLKGAADLMHERAANIALARLLAELESLLRPQPSARLESDVNAAVAALLPPAASGQTATASRYLPVVAASSDPLFLQSVGRVLEHIEWTQVPSSLVEEWSEYCIQHLAGQDDHRFPATVLVRALPATERLRRAVLQAWEQQPDLLTAANALVLGDVPPTLVRRATRMAIGELRKIRADASLGTHGFGAFIDVPLFLTHVLLDYPGQSGWQSLSAFLRDPAVAPSKKTGPIREILRRFSEVPAYVHRSLRAWVRNEVRYAEIPMETADEFKGSILRLRFHYRARPPETLLAELLAQATSESRAARHEAAETLRFAADFLPPATVVTLAITLSKDRMWEVRGPAASVLARLASRADPPLASLVWQSLETTLRDPGAIAPLWVLNGLAGDPPPDLPSGILSVVRGIAKEHVSLAVRQAAARLLTLVEGVPMNDHAEPPPLA